MNAIVSKQSNPVSRLDIGKKVLVFSDKVGSPSFEAFIKTIDELSGRIIEVVVKDQDKEDKIIQVKTKVVSLMYELPKWIQFLIDLFKK